MKHIKNHDCATPKKHNFTKNDEFQQISNEGAKNPDLLSICVQILL